MPGFVGERQPMNGVKLTELGGRAPDPAINMGLDPTPPISKVNLSDRPTLGKFRFIKNNKFSLKMH